jgi:hypothetical protein
VIKKALAYPVVCRDYDLQRFSIHGSSSSGATVPSTRCHWILGKQAVKREPRWSIMRNVLRWVS